MKTPAYYTCRLDFMLTAHTHSKTTSFVNLRAGIAKLKHYITSIHQRLFLSGGCWSALPVDLLCLDTASVSENGPVNPLNAPISTINHKKTCLALNYGPLAVNWDKLQRLGYA